MKWEYIITESETDLSDLGKRGWELVTAIQHQEYIKFYLKRPVQTFTERVTDEQKVAVANQLQGEK